MNSPPIAPKDKIHTIRLKQIAKLVIDGHSIKEIAAKLDLSLPTVYTLIREEEFAAVLRSLDPTVAAAFLEEVNERNAKSAQMTAKGLINEAIEGLAELMRLDGAKHSTVKLEASKTILGIAGVPVRSAVSDDPNEGKDVRLNPRQLSQLMKALRDDE